MAAKQGFCSLSGIATLIVLILISFISACLYFLVITERPNALRGHVLELSSGSNVVESVATYARKSQRGICILTASGNVTNVSVRQPFSAGAIVNLHGRFEILSLTGSFLPPPAPPGATSLTIFLSGGQGQVIGGNVVGDLIAVGPVIIVASSFANVAYERLPSNKQEPIKQPSWEVSDTGFDGNYLFPDPPSGIPIFQVLQ